VIYTDLFDGPGRLHNIFVTKLEMYNVGDVAIYKLLGNRITMMFYKVFL